LSTTLLPHRTGDLSRKRGQRSLAQLHLLWLSNKRHYILLPEEERERLTEKEAI
jgi:hypothetical protein